MFDVASQLEQAKNLYQSNQIINSLKVYQTILMQLEQKSIKAVELSNSRDQIAEIEQILKEDLSALEAGYQSFLHAIDAIAAKSTNFTLNPNLAGTIACCKTNIKLLSAQSHEKLGDIYSKLHSEISVLVNDSSYHNAAMGNYERAVANYLELKLENDAERVNKMAIAIYTALNRFEKANSLKHKISSETNKRKSDEIVAYDSRFDLNNLTDDTIFSIEIEPKKLKVETAPKRKVSFNDEKKVKEFYIGDIVPAADLTKTKPVKSNLRSQFFAPSKKVDANNNNNEVTSAVLSSKLLPIFQSMFEKPSNQKKLTYELIGELLRVIGHYHLQFLFDDTAEDISEPFPQDLYFGPASKEMTAMNLLNSRSALKLGLDCLYTAMLTYGNHIAAEEFLKYTQLRFDKKSKKNNNAEKEVQTVTLYQKYHCHYDYKPKLINTNIKPGELLVTEMQAYCMELELILEDYPELLDQFLLRLCAFIGDSCSITSLIKFAQIFDAARETMQTIVAIELDDELDNDIEEDAENDEELGSVATFQL